MGTTSVRSTGGEINWMNRQTYSPRWRKPAKTEDQPKTSPRPAEDQRWIDKFDSRFKKSDTHRYNFAKYCDNVCMPQVVSVVGLVSSDQLDWL